MTLAVVTGASAGLGERFVEALAKEGHDLLLVARRAERLDTLARAMRSRHGRAVDTLALDLSEPNATARVEAALGGARVDVLVNNAGFGLRGDFASLDGKRQAAMVQLNCTALIELCHAVLPGMIAARAGGILNVASTAAFQPGPYMAVYYATKAFVLSFSEALHEEVRGSGVRVSALCPGPTRTEFAGVAGMNDMALFERLASDPERVVRDGLEGLRENDAVRVSGALNAALANAVTLTPRGLARRLVGGFQKRRSG